MGCKFEYNGEWYEEADLKKMFQGLETPDEKVHILSDAEVADMKWSLTRAQYQLSVPIRQAEQTFEAMPDKKKMSILSTAENLVVNHPLKYLSVMNKGRVYVRMDDLIKDIRKELGDQIIPKKAQEEADAYFEQISNIDVSDKVSNWKKVLNDGLEYDERTIRDLNLYINSKEYDAADLFTQLINTSTYNNSKDVYFSIPLKGADGNTYAFRFVNGKLDVIYKQIVTKKKDYTSTNHEVVEDEDEQIAANIALNNFKKDRARIEKAINVLLIKQLENSAAKTKEQLTEDIEAHIKEEEMYMAMEAYSPSDILNFGVENLVKNVLIYNNIIDEDNYLSKDFGITADELLSESNNASYRELEAKKKLINKIIDNKEAYNLDLDQWETEDSDMLAPMPGWWVNAFTVYTRGTLFNEIKGFFAGMVKTIIMMQAQEEYDNLHDKGQAPSFQKLLDTKNISELLPRGIQHASPLNINQRQAQFNQAPGTESSKASPKTLALVNKFLERIGVTKSALPQYDLAGKKIDANGQAQLLNDMIRLAEGKEGVALTEEAMHFAVAIIKQTNPQLFKQMMNKVGTFNYYKQIFNEYSKRYVNKDGTPDILKIKEEAIGKILAEYLIKDTEGSTEKPELLAQTLSWWQQIKDFFLALIGKATFNPFQEALGEMNKIEDTSALDAPYKELVDRIMSHPLQGIYGMAATNAYKQGRYRGVVTMFSEQLEDPETYQTIVDSYLEGDEALAQEILKAGEGFLQTAPATESIFDKINKRIADFQLVKHPDKGDVEEENNNSYYTVNINGKEVKADRTTSWADRENIKRNGGVDYFANPTPEQEKKWAQKAMSGTNGHKAIEGIIAANLNPDKTLKPKDQWAAPQTTLVDHSIYVEMSRWLLGYRVPVTGEIKPGFLDQFPAGAKFGVENMLYNDKPHAKVVNKKTKKVEELFGRASTTDLMVVMPDDSIKIYDWKFMGFLLEKPDQTFLKRGQHALQLGDYKTSLREAYGAKKVDAYTVPIHAQYKETPSDVKLVGVTFGNVNFKNETRTSLLPVIPQGQSSGNKQVDQLVASLEAHYKKIYGRKENPDTKHQKIEQLQQLSNAIRNLQVALNFDPLAADVDNFILSSNKILEKYAELDFTGLDEEGLTKQLDELLEVVHSAETYSGIDEVFRSEYADNLTPEQKVVLDKLALGATAAGILKGRTLDILKKYVTFIAQKEGVDNISSPTKEIKGMLNTMLERGSILSPMANLAVQRLLDKRSKDKQIVSKEINKFGELYLALEKLASSTGKKAFELIGDGNKLIKKVKKEFWDSFNDAIAKQNKQFILDNIDQEAFIAEVNEEVGKRLDIINETNYTTNVEENNKRRKYYTEKLVNAFDLGSKDFNGWNERQFINMVKKHIIEEPHWTKEYRALHNKGNEAALAVHSYLYDMNKKAFKLGYLGAGNSMAFFPMVTGTMFERLAQANSVTGTLQDIFSDLYKVDASQEQAYGKTNPETGELEKTIPKLFTRTNREEEALSKDLLKVIPLYIRALQEYSTSKDLEMEMLTYEMVERAKGHLEEEAGQVVFDAEGPKEFKGNENNANILKDLLDYSVYGIKESSNTFFDKAASSLTKGSEEEKKTKAISAKKLLTQGNMLTQSLAVGLKALVAIPNFVGNHMQAAVNAGLYYPWKDFAKNHARILGGIVGATSDIEKGLMDLIVPLNDDVVREGQRKIARKQSVAKWLGTWTFQEFMMSTNQYPDKLIQLTNAKSFNDNAMVVNGEIVNIKQHLLSLPEYQQRYKDPSSLKQKERELNDKIKELKETKSLAKIAKFNEEGYLEIPGVSEEALAKYRTSVVEYGRKITGQMSSENSAKYRQDILVKSFMMFKNWIPKQVALRTLDIKYNPSMNQWEYGRTRLFWKTLNHLGARNILNMRDIITASPRGIEIMKEMVDKKREEYFRKTGLELTITDEEFYDMVRKELAAQMKELAILVSLVGLVVSAKLAAPPDDDDPLAKNRYKFWAKATNKIFDEMWFYYNPTSAESITRGSLFPSLSLLTKVEKTLHTAGKDLFGYIQDDEEAMKKAHTLKYFFNIVPVASQFQNELFPIVDPEGAKEWGIVTSSQARAMR